MNETVLTLNGVIDSYGWFRYQVESFLNKNKDVPVRIKLDSYGGSVEEALAISRLLEDHGDVTVEFMGYVASAATWMAFGAKHIEMHEDTLWLCHKCSVSISEWGYKKAEELDQLIKELKAQKKSAEVIDLTIARKYLERCTASGKTLQDVLALMDEERYITSSDCLDWGFVDKVIPGMNQSDRQTISNFVNQMHLPPVPKEDIPDKSGNTAQESLLNRFLSALASMFNDRKTDEKPETVEEPQHTTQTQNKMREDFKTVNALLGVTGLPVSDEKIVLTPEQVNAIEEALAGMNGVVEALDSISEHVRNIKGTANKVNALKLLVDCIPTGLPGSSSQADTGDKTDTPDTADMNDPVNEYARNNFKKKN